MFKPLAGDNAINRLSLMCWDMIHCQQVNVVSKQACITDHSLYIVGRTGLSGEHIFLLIEI